jgi:hypothetical protein
MKKAPLPEGSGAFCFDRSRSVSGRVGSSSAHAFNPAHYCLIASTWIASFTSGLKPIWVP